jgi:hypothetical protein
MHRSLPGENFASFIAAAGSSAMRNLSGALPLGERRENHGRRIVLFERIGLFIGSWSPFARVAGRLTYEFSPKTHINFKHDPA